MSKFSPGVSQGFPQGSVGVILSGVLGVGLSHFGRCFWRLREGGAGANEGVVGGTEGMEGEVGDGKPGRRAQDSGRASRSWQTSDRVG